MNETKGSSDHDIQWKYSTKPIQYSIQHLMKMSMWSQFPNATHEVHKGPSLTNLYWEISSHFHNNYFNLYCHQNTSFFIFTNAKFLGPAVTVKQKVLWSHQSNNQANVTWLGTSNKCINIYIYSCEIRYCTSGYIIIYQMGCGYRRLISLNPIMCVGAWKECLIMSLLWYFISVVPIESICESIQKKT